MLTKQSRQFEQWAQDNETTVLISTLSTEATTNNITSYTSLNTTSLDLGNLNTTIEALSTTTLKSNTLRVFNQTETFNSTTFMLTTILNDLNSTNFTNSTDINIHVFNSINLNETISN